MNKKQAEDLKFKQLFKSSPKKECICRVIKSMTNLTKSEKPICPVAGHPLKEESCRCPVSLGYSTHWDFCKFRFQPKSSKSKESERYCRCHEFSLTECGFCRKSKCWCLDSRAENTWSFETERKITNIIGHSDSCKGETGYEQDCSCYIKELTDLLLKQREEDIQFVIDAILDFVRGLNLEIKDFAHNDGVLSLNLVLDSKK